MRTRLTLIVQSSPEETINAVRSATCCALESSIVRALGDRMVTDKTAVPASCASVWNTCMTRHHRSKMDVAVVSQKLWPVR